MKRTLIFWLALGLALVPLASGVAFAGAIVSNAFNSNTLAGNDDGSTSLVDLGFSANFFGTTYTSLYVNNNGNITFDSAQSTYTPFGLTSNTGTPIIAPFFADVDTRVGNALTYGTGTYEGHNAFGVNWVDVGYYAEHTDKLDSFQVILVDRSDVAAGDFDIVYNYDQIQWETGDASGGSGGLGGSSAHVGYSNGSGNSGTNYEFAGSGVNGALLDTNSSTGLIYNSNVGVNGRYVFDVRNGTPQSNYSRYDFTFYYDNGNGDSYTGSVYALTGYNGYQVGYTQSVTDENGQPGYYDITAATALGSDSSHVGEVYVSSYYDSQIGHTYTPVGNSAALGTNYLDSEVGYIIQSGIPEFEFGQGTNGTFYEADVGAYSRYDFTFVYGSGSGDYYVGYVYAPTSMQTDNLQFAVGTKLYDQPMEFWASGYKSFGGGYYDITAITDGFAAAYDKQSYITAYYDANTSQALLGINSDKSATASYIYVADRTAAWEAGYAISGANYASFSPYAEANVTTTAASTALVSSALAAAPPSASASVSAPQSQAVWAAYWTQTASLLDEEQYR